MISYVYKCIDLLKGCAASSARKFVWVLLPLFLPNHGVAADIQIFILHSYHQEYPWTNQENNGIVKTLQKEYADRDIDFSTEYLDTKRVRPTEEYQSFYKEYLQRKYADLRPDVIVVTDDNALKFMMRHRHEIFVDAPLVFCGVNDTLIARNLKESNVHGVFEVKDVAANLKLIEGVFPKVKNITFIGDESATYKAIYQQISTVADNDFQMYDFRFIAHADFSRVEDMLKMQQSDIIVLTTIGRFQEDSGMTLSIGEVIDRLRSQGDFAIISMEDSYMHKGVLGGVVTSGMSQGSAAAEQVIHILRNKGGLGSQYFGVGPNIPTFDYEELRRLKVQLSRLPDNAVILNRPLSLYEQFRGVFFTVIIAFSMMLVLIIFLLLSIVRRNKAESELQENQSFLNSVLQYLPDMVFVKDARELRFVRLNKAGEFFFGETQDKVIGRNDYDYFPKEEADFFTEKDREAIANKVLVDIPQESIQSPAGERYLHTKKIPIFDKENNPLYLLGISRDITEEINAVQERRELEEKLKQAQKMESIGTLAGGIAHDFNNILSSIIGYTELAQRQSNEPELVEKLLDGTLKGADRAKQLVRQILTFSRKGEQRQELVVLADVIREGLDLLRSSLPSTIVIKEDLRSRAQIIADPTQMHQIVMNLGTNGYHAMQDRGGTLSFFLDEVKIDDANKKVVTAMHDGRYMLLEIGDTGHGMRRETLLRMFDPYFTTKGPDSGTGLGLAVAHGIIKSHGGYVAVESEINVGTKISIYLPVAEKEPDVHMPAGDSPQVMGGSESILFVDDEPDIISLTEHYLTSYGYKIKSYNNSYDALKEYSRNPMFYDLVITDMTMPGQTGAEMAMQMLEVDPKVPIILCTGHSASIDAEKALSMGLRAYCEKPVTIDELLLTIRRVLDDQ